MPQLIKTLIVVAGPTAIGKTALAIQLARHYNTDIISADSRQLYSEMSVGTARPSEQELQLAKHHFIASHSIHTPITVGEFEEKALERLNDLFKNKDFAILVGGSGLFINAVCKGFDSIPKASADVRANLNQLYQIEGLENLQQYLLKVDPKYYSEADINNPQRVIRALEVWETSGKPFSSYRINKATLRPFQSVFIGLNTTREELYQRINQRVDLMMTNGLLTEARSLAPYADLSALKTVGYRELFDFLNNKITLEQAVEKIKQNTRRFAKRQLTWFNNQTEMKWFSPDDVSEIIDHINQQLSLRPGHAE